MAREWFRTPDWDDDARQDFERRLSRARPHNQSQYLRIKAIALREAGSQEAARALLRRIVSEYPTSIDVSIAEGLLGDLDRTDGRPREALAWYAAAIEHGQAMNVGVDGDQLSRAEVLAEIGDFVGALVALEDIDMQTVPFNSAHFRWNAILASAASAVGDTETARHAARRALKLLDAPDPFSRHPGVGRATASNDEKARLETISTEPAPKRGRRWLRR